MCTQARIPSGSRRNESASSKSLAVSGSIVIVGSSRRSTRARLEAGRLGQVVRLELDPRAPLDEQRLEHVLDPLRRAEALHDVRPPAAGLRRPRGRRFRARRSPSVSSISGTPGVKYGSPVRACPAGRPRRRPAVAAHRRAYVRTTGADRRCGGALTPVAFRRSDAQEAAERERRSRARRAQRPMPIRISAVSGKASACTSGAVGERCGGSRAARPPCR